MTSFVQSSQWERLRSLTLELGLKKFTDFEKMAECLAGIHPPRLENVTVRVLMSARTIYFKEDEEALRVDACLKFETALCKFPRHHLSFRLISMYWLRKGLWTRELGRLFPLLRQSGRLTITMEKGALKRYRSRSNHRPVNSSNP